MEKLTTFYLDNDDLRAFERVGKIISELDIWPTGNDLIELGKPDNYCGCQFMEADKLQNVREYELTDRVFFMNKE